MNLEEKRKELAKWILETDENVLNEIEAVYNTYSKTNKISKEHKQILDERLKIHHKNPKEGKVWNELKTELSSKYGI